MGRRDEWEDGLPADFEPLLLLAQSAPIADRPWREFVASLRQALDANYANLIFRRRDREHENLEVHDGADVPDWLWSRYAAGVFRLDPIRYFAMEPGRVYAYDELEGVVGLAQDRFRDEFLRPAGFYHLLLFRVTEPEGCSIWITVTRPEAAPAFGHDERELCARLARHLVPILSCHVVLLDRQADIETYRRASETLAIGVITLDAAGRVLAADPAARSHLRASKGLRIVNDRLCAGAAEVALRRRLDEAIRLQETRSLHLGDLDGLDLLCAPLRQRVDAPPGRAALLVYLSARRPHRRDISGHLAELFGLTKTQARLAALLAEGRTLAAAAAEVGLTEQSARTYSKEIYARTGTSRQGELIQRILTSVAVLT